MNVLVDYIKNSPSTLMISLSILVNILLVWKLRDMINIFTKKQAMLFGVLLTLFGIGSISFFYQLSGWIMPGILHSGIFGLFCFGVLLMYLISRVSLKRFGDMLDVFAVLMSVYGALNRICCLITGCCSGVELPWGDLHWPNRELEVAFFLISFFVLMHFRTTTKFPGQMFLYFMIGYGAFRFLNEFLSKGQELFYGLKIAHIWSFLCVAVGISVYSELSLRVERNKRHKKNGGNLRC